MSTPTLSAPTNPASLGRRWTFAAGWIFTPRQGQVQGQWTAGGREKDSRLGSIPGRDDAWPCFNHHLEEPSRKCRPKRR
jgi:hypothetical protein